MIITWNCTFCMWANDNNNGPCRRCGGHTEMRMVNGRWKEVTIKEPNRPSGVSPTATLIKEKP
jgi:hypothetical protein